MSTTPKLAALDPYPEHPSERRKNSEAARESPASRTRQGRKSSASIGRFASLNAFVDFVMLDLTRAELTAWLVLYRDTRDGLVQVSIDSVAQRTGTSRQHTQKAIAALQRRGLLTQVKKGSLNQGASVYRLKTLTAKDAITVHPQVDSNRTPVGGYGPMHP